MICAACGTELSEGAKFCSSCGTPQSKGDEERRVVTVLFADIVGFTGLAERLDPEEVKHRVDSCFDRLAIDISSFGGVVDKILGDGIIALFGAPVAHEDDAERAVRAGLRMQQTLAAMANEMEAPFRMRVGVNTGEVLVGASASGRDYTAMGDVVNSAARLQQFASPGQVLVGAATQTATREAISYDEIGPLSVKGREEALGAWLALSAVRPPGARTRRATDFVGRERELEVLHAQARMAVELNQAQIATVFGEAGTGKTRLVEEAAGQLASRFGARVLEGRCVPYGEANVWWPIAEVLRHAFGLAHDASQDEAIALLRTELHAHLPNESHDDIPRFEIALLHALGFETHLRGGDRLRNRAEVTLAVTRIFEIELERRPIVLVLSDVHWAAEAVWELVRHLLSELSRSRLIVLVTARRSETSETVAGRFGALVIELGPLDSDSSRLLIGELGIDVPEEQLQELVDRSGGNPFFLEELVGLVKSRDGSAVTPGDGVTGQFDAVPDNLRGILAARLDRLDGATRQVLENAAVLGRSGPVDGLQTMLTESGFSQEIGAALERLEDADLLAVNGNRYEFLSDLIREVAYGTITKTARARMHAGIAYYLESTESPNVRNSIAVAVARHFTAAAELLKDLRDVPNLDPVAITSKALHWAAEAGWRAIDAGAPADAVGWFGSGLELSDDDDETRAHFLFGRAKARCETRDVAGARRDLDRLEPLTIHDPILAARALVVSGDIDQKAGDLDRAAGQLREASDRLDELGELSEQALALRLLGTTEMSRGDETMALRALNSSRAVATEAGNRKEEAWAIQSLAWFAFTTGRLADAKGLVVEAEEIFTAIDDRGGLAWTRGVEAWVSFHVGDWDRARELVAAVLPETRRRGDPWAEAVMLNLQASMALWSGEADNALTLSHSAQQVAERAEDFALVVQSQAVEGRAMISRGRVAEGLITLEQSYALADRLGNQEGRRLAVVGNCAASARLGDADRAIRWAARFDGPHADLNVVGESDLSVSLALALLQRGAVAEAASQISWIDSFGDEPPNMYGEAVGAIIAASEDNGDLARRKSQAVIDGRSTYLDKILANLAMAAVAFRGNDGSDVVVRHLSAARSELTGTDDVVSPRIVDLVAAICDQGSMIEAEEALTALSIDPTGWKKAWSLAARPGSIAV